MKEKMAMIGIMAALIISMIGAVYAHGTSDEDYGYGMMDTYGMMGSQVYNDMDDMQNDMMTVPVPGTCDNFF